MIVAATGGATTSTEDPAQEATMIIVRNVFRLKFGKAREAVALWQEGIDAMRQKGLMRDARLLTDFSGEFYTLVMELPYDSLTALEEDYQSTTGDAEWKAWYQRFVPLVESGYREIFNVVGSSVPPLPGAGASAARARAGKA